MEFNYLKILATQKPSSRVSFSPWSTYNRLSLTIAKLVRHYELDSVSLNFFFFADGWFLFRWFSKEWLHNALSKGMHGYWVLLIINVKGVTGRWSSLSLSSLLVWNGGKKIWEERGAYLFILFLRGWLPRWWVKNFFEF